MALQALAEYAILSYAGGINLTVSLASTNLDYQETFELHRANQKLLQMAAVRAPGTRVGGWAATAARPCCLSVHVGLRGKPRHLLSPDPQPPHGAVCERQGRRLLPDAGEAAGRGGASRAPLEGRAGGSSVLGQVEWGGCGCESHPRAACQPPEMPSTLPKAGPKADGSVSP